MSEKNVNHPETARRLVFEHVKSRLEPRDTHINFVLENVYVVSFFYVLGNWKAFLSTTLPNGMYYEVTRNESQNETYVTAYKQWEHVTVRDQEAA